MPDASPSRVHLSTFREACRQAGDKRDKFDSTQAIPRFAIGNPLLNPGEIGQWPLVPEIHRANKHQQLL
jgi:hypothetical protein